jgi:hypothetical protein
MRVLPWEVDRTWSFDHQLCIAIGDGMHVYLNLERQLCGQGVHLPARVTPAKERGFHVPRGSYVFALASAPARPPRLLTRSLHPPPLPCLLGPLHPRLVLFQAPQPHARRLADDLAQRLIRHELERPL